MATVKVENVRLAGIVSAVPDRTRTWEDDAKLFGADEMQRVIRNTGVTRRAVAEHLCTSDLCQAAAEELLQRLRWPKDSIDAVVLVTQTPDYPSPATACLIQNRLGLPTGVAAFDINLGCSGYTYGIWIVSALLASGAIRRALLLAGDTVSRAAAPTDRAVVPLFGDGGSATALEYAPGAPPFTFDMGTNGAGGIHLHTLAGASRHPIKAPDLEDTLRHDGVTRSNQHTYMNGAEVLSFAISNVAPTVNRVCAAAGWKAEEVESYVFHQASRFMLKNIGRCLRLPATGSQLVIGLDGYGNTSSASIPVAMCDQLQHLNERAGKLVLAGFGIGWSWCAMTAQVGPLVLPPVLRVPDEPRVSEFDLLEAHKVVKAPPAAG